MGSGEEATPGKDPKPTSSTQAETLSTPSYADWATQVQAYYGATPPGFLQSPVPSSPLPLPYMWGGQHLMPPYGPPLPYPALYTHGGIYTHPSMGPVPVASATDVEGKTSGGKAHDSTKKSKGTTGNLGFGSGKSENGGKTGRGSGNEGISYSGESGTEDSSGASEDNESQDMQDTRKRGYDQMLVDGSNSQVKSDAQYTGPSAESSFNVQARTSTNPPMTVPGKPAGLTTNLNIGMDLWSSSPAGSVNVKERSTATGVSSIVVPTTIIGREGLPPDLWIQDERELKRQRRKQSNQESARRSRLRKQPHLYVTLKTRIQALKQAECEELASKVDLLNAENQKLRTELQRLSDECEKLTSENASIMEQLSRHYGPEALTMLDQEDSDITGFPTVSSEDNGHSRDLSRESNSVSGTKNNKFFNTNGKLECMKN